MNSTLGTWLCLLRGNRLALGFRLELQPEPGAQQGREEMAGQERFNFKEYVLNLCYVPGSALGVFTQ